MDPRPLACWICGKVVDLNKCTTDEQGLPVHEVCYVARITLISEPEQIDPTAT